MFPVLHACIFFSAYEVCLKLFLKRWEEENFEWRHRRTKESISSMLVSVPRDAITCQLLISLPSMGVKKILSMKKKHTGGGGFKPTCTLHAALPTLISVDWARFQSLLSLT